MQCSEKSIETNQVSSGRGYKPDFVRRVDSEYPTLRRKCSGWGTRKTIRSVAIIPLGLRSLESSMRPTRGFIPSKRRTASQGKILRTASRFSGPSASRASSSLLFGLAPRGVCQAPDIATGTVGSYPTFSPLPVRRPNWPARGFASCRPPRRIPHWRSIFCGTFRSRSVSAPAP